MKKCITCGVIKPIGAFYRHSQMADGHLNKCKPCVVAYANSYREKHLERIQKYDRDRAGLPKRRQLRKENYRRRTATKAGRKREWQKKEEWRRRNKVKRAAHAITSNAVRTGRLIKQPCIRCGSRRNIHAHHEDYFKPLEVMWLCRTCHGKRHRELNEKARK